MTLIAMAGDAERVIVIDNESDQRIGRVLNVRTGHLSQLMLVGSIAVMGEWPDLPEPWPVPASMIRRGDATPAGYERDLWRRLIYADSGLVWQRGRWERIGEPQPLAAASTWWGGRPFDLRHTKEEDDRRV